MRIELLSVIGLAVITSGCQSTASYEQYMAGPPLEYAQAKCNMLAPATNEGFIAFGSASYVAGAALGNAIGNAVREQQFVKNCMAVQGWKQVSNNGKSGAKPATTKQAYQSKPIREGKPTAQELGISVPVTVTR